MIIIPSGNSATFTLAANNQLTVTSRGGTTVTGPGGLLGTIDGTMTFGGYGGDTIITIAAVGNDCEYGVTEPDAAMFSTDASGNTVLVGADGASVLRGPMVSGAWLTSPSVFRLRLTGTGSVQFDSRNSAGTVTAVATYTLSGATDQIEFPYAGDNAVAIRATFNGDITVEVL